MPLAIDECNNAWIDQIIVLLIANKSLHPPTGTK